MRQREEKHQQDAHDCGDTHAPSKQRRQHKKSMIQSSWRRQYSESCMTCARVSASSGPPLADRGPDRGPQARAPFGVARLGVQIDVSRANWRQYSKSSIDVRFRALSRLLKHTVTTCHPDQPVKRARVFFSARVGPEGSAPLLFLRPQAEPHSLSSLPSRQPGLS